MCVQTKRPTANGQRPTGKRANGQTAISEQQTDAQQIKRNPMSPRLVAEKKINEKNCLCVYQLNHSNRHDYAVVPAVVPAQALLALLALLVFPPPPSGGCSQKLAANRPHQTTPDHHHHQSTTDKNTTRLIAQTHQTTTITLLHPLTGRYCTPSPPLQAHHCSPPAHQPTEPTQ